MKYQPDPNALITLALYDLTQSNVATYNSAAGWFENSGKVRSKGVEAAAHATLFENLNLIASYTYTDAETVNTTVVGTEGKRQRVFRPIWLQPSPAIPCRTAR